MENSTTGSIEAVRGVCDVSELVDRVGRARNSGFDDAMSFSLVSTIEDANFFFPFFL